LHRAGEVAQIRRSWTGTGGIREYGAPDGPLDVSAPLRALSAVRDRRSVVVVAVRICAPGPVACAPGVARGERRFRRQPGGPGGRARAGRDSSSEIAPRLEGEDTCSRGVRR